MSADVQLLALERAHGERLVVRFVRFQSDGHGVEVAIERKTIDGWRLQRRIVLFLSEIFVLHDAIGAACQLAKACRR